MKLPWNRKPRTAVEAALATHDGWSFRHPSDPRLSPRMSVREARDAVYKVVTETNERGALDAGNGDAFDAWIDSLRPQWIAHHVMSGADGEAAAQLAAGEYAASAAAARQRAEAMKAERDHTRRLVDIYEQRLLSPAEEPGLAHADRRRRPRPGLDALEGLTPQRGWKVLSWVLLALAAGGDLASFYIVLAGTLGGNEVMVVLLTAALTAAAVGLMHMVGRSSRNLREGHGGLGRMAMAVMAGGWLALGAAAFYLRLSEEPVTAAGAFGAAVETTDTALLSAILLAALYLGSGLLAFWIGFSDHHPRMTPYLQLRKDLRDFGEQVAQFEQKAIEAERLRDNANAEVQRTATRTAAAEAAVDAEISELKELVRIHIAGLIGEPAATNNLTSGRSVAPPPNAVPAIPTPALPVELPRTSLNGNGHPAGAR